MQSLVLLEQLLNVEMLRIVSERIQVTRLKKNIRELRRIVRDLSGVCGFDVLALQKLHMLMILFQLISGACLPRK